MSDRSDTVRITLLGDVALGGASSRPDVRAVQSCFSNSDLGLVSLDCALDEEGTPPRSDEYLISANPERLDLLRQLRIDVASLANNHSMDFGWESLQVTMRHLSDQRIAPVGVGEDALSARRAVVVPRGGMNIGILAYASTHRWVGALAAGATSPGVAAADPATMLADVAELAARTDCVIVSIHWGKEYIQYPPPENRALAHKLVDAGARIIVGHHPHVIQGWERYGGGIIYYSLGNFLFPDYPEQGLAFHGSAQIGLASCLFLDGSGSVASEELIPVQCNALGVVKPLAGSARVETLAHVESISSVLQDQDYEQAWKSEVRRHEWRRLRRVVREELLEAGWRDAARRVFSLGRKNLLSVGRSLVEIAFGGGGNRK